MSRWPLAFGCLALGLLGGIVATQRLTAQPPAVPQLNAALPGREWQSFAPVAKRVLPGVVCIEGKGRAKRTAGEDTDPGFGSGVLIDPTGVILTNNHVVADLDVVDVTLQDGRKFTATDIRRDPKSDLALIKLADVKDLPVLEFGDSDAMEPGDRVLAFGAPFGLTGSVTQRHCERQEPEQPEAEPVRGLHPDRRRDEPRQQRRPAGEHGRQGDRADGRDQDAHAAGSRVSAWRCRATSRRRSAPSCSRPAG